MRCLQITHEGYKLTFTIPDISRRSPLLVCLYSRPPIPLVALLLLVCYTNRVYFSTDLASQASAPRKRSKTLQDPHSGAPFLHSPEDFCCIARPRCPTRLSIRGCSACKPGLGAVVHIYRVRWGSDGRPIGPPMGSDGSPIGPPMGSDGRPIGPPMGVRGSNGGSDGRPIGPPMGVVWGVRWDA